MKRLINEVWNLRQKCAQYQNNVNSILQNPLPSDLRSGCFGMIYNTTTLTLELLSHYYEQWKKPHIVISEEDLRRSRDENAQRCIEITKMQFISFISSIEYCIKETMSLYPKHHLAKWCSKQQQRKRRIYLGGIITESKRIGLIDKKEYESWDCILKVRNAVVHNNGIADHDKTYQINGATVSFFKGKMLRGKLDFFVRLTDKAIDLYYSWVMNLIK